MGIADLLSGKQLYIFGAGNAGRAVAEAIPYEIHRFIDNDPKKWGRTLFGAQIASPDILSEMDSSGLIIVSSIYWEEIKQQLQRYGLTEGTHFCNGYGELDKLRAAFESAPFKVYDEIQNMNLGDYQIALDHIVDKVKERYKLSSVYTFGEISHASISDLDVVLVLNEKKQKLFEIKDYLQAEISSDERLSYIYEHPPMLLDVDISRFVSVFHTVKNIKKVWGKDCIEHLEKDPFFYEKTMIWNYNFYKHFQAMMSKKKIGSREACMRLKNVAHSIQNNAMAAGEPRNVEVDQIVETTRTAALERKLTPDMLLEAIERLDRFFKETEPNFLSRNGLRLTGIQAFTEPYMMLYQDFMTKRSPYIRAVDQAMETLRLSYREVRQLIGSMSIMDIDEYK